MPLLATLWRSRDQLRRDATGERIFPVPDDPRSREGDGAGATAAAVLADATLAGACHLAAYRLRYDADFSHVLAPALRALPLIVVPQILALMVAGVYSYREGRRWLPRLIAGVAGGTAIGSLLIVIRVGVEGVARASLVIGPLLFLLAAFTWRGALGLWRLGRYARALQSATDAMLDRADAEQASVSAGLVGLLRYRELLRNLVLKDLKLKYRGSVFGFLWSLANPLLMIAVYSVAFTYILRVTAEGFLFLLMLGLLAWTFFANAAGMSTGSIVDSGGLVRSVFFPRAVLPVATVLFNFAQYLLTVLVFIPLMLLIYRVPPSWPMLLYPVFLALQVLFAVGIAFLLATATAFFRDVRHILEIALSALFWTTPIVYVFRQVPEALQLPILLSPMSSFVVAYQEIFFYREWPDLSLWLVALTYGIGAFVLGAVVFATYEHRFAEHV